MRCSRAGPASRARRLASPSSSGPACSSRRRMASHSQRRSRRDRGNALTAALAAKTELRITLPGFCSQSKHSGVILAPMNSTRLPLAMIAALARNRVIGLDNQMPWHLPADLKHFKAMTLGKPIIMGRKTWDSLGRPLPGRLNIVVSRQTDLRLDGAEVFASLEDAIARADAWAREQGVDELMLIGGAKLYAQALPLAE